MAEDNDVDLLSRRRVFCFFSCVAYLWARATGSHFVGFRNDPVDEKSLPFLLVCEE